jgi:hypothetical protein
MQPCKHGITWKDEESRSVVMGRNRKVINEIRKRVDDIQTEATRLLVFADNAPDAAQRARLKNAAKVIFKRAMAIESSLTLLKATKSGRRKGPRG